MSEDEQKYYTFEEIQGEDFPPSKMSNHEKINGVYDLYWHVPDDHESMFHFCCINLVRQYTYPKGLPDEYEVIAQGVAYHDGIRHIRLFPGSNCGSGYDCYPDLDSMRILFSRLLEIEKQVCPNI